MLGIRTWLRLVLLAGLGFALLQGGQAWAASFEINPVRVSLSSTTSSGLIAVHNLSTEPLRFQATAFAWKQGLNRLIFFIRLHNLFYIDIRNLSKVFKLCQ